jgi:hypothetical protein
MPVLKCNAITAHGFCCINRAKVGSDKCKMHKNSDNANALQFLQNRANFIVSMDFRNRIITPVNLFAVPMPRTPETIARAIQRVEAQEAVVRQDYPGYLGQFAAKFKKEIEEYHPQRGGVLRAEGRVPNQLKHQIPLMHDWFEYLRARFDRAGMFVPLNDLYNEDHVTGELRRGLTNRWNALTIPLQEEFMRAFRNLTLLGQLHINTLSIGLMVRVEAELVVFGNDSQNVHRTATVSYIKQIFDTLMTIEVPTNQKTLGLVLTNCNLSDAATMQAVRFYTEKANIYEIDKAYTRALDAVIAYVEKHPERTELYERVTQELTDNVGMCSQGNLSRICNILSGYIDGIAPPVSKHEMMQNKISAIAMDSEGNKIERAKAYMREIGIPETNWGPWIEAIEAF